MKADECIINARSKLEAVERLLKDKRINKQLGDEIRRHCLLSQSSPSINQSSLYRSLESQKFSLRGDIWIIILFRTGSA